MISYNTLVVLAGAALLGAGAGVVGSFAVLRRRALTGDALSHATLPGLCLAFLLLGERSLPAMLTGALCTGVLGVAVISGLRRWTRVKEDAAIGMVLGVFFGAGVALLSVIQRLSTAGSKAGLGSFIFGKTAGMIAADVYLIAGTSALCVLLIVLLYKEFKLVVFDPGFAQAQGWPVLRLDLLLMSLVAVAVVIGLPAVGAVLMAALLILPAAAARFWTDRLGTMLILSAAFGTAIGLVGTTISVQFERFPTGPIIVVTGAALFLVSMLFAPRRGAVARALAQRRFCRELAAGEIRVEFIEADDGEADTEGSPAPAGAVSLDANVDANGSTLAAARPQPPAAPSSVTAPTPFHASSRFAADQWSLRRLLAIVGVAAVALFLFRWWWMSLPTDDRPLAAWTIAIGCLVNISCAVLGCYLVLRRMSLLGDAISHAVLPGIVLAFLLTGQITGVPILLGAMALGVLTTMLTHALTDIGRVPEDSSMGIVYTTLFAIGVILLSRFAAGTHLDADCVLYGLLDTVALDTIGIGPLEVPRVLPTLLAACVIVFLFIGLLWKELKIASFDAGLASAMGLSAGVVHYLLMGMVAGVTVAAFEAIGSILVIAMLIVPAATAHLLADRLGPMIGWSIVVAVLSAVVGYASAQALNTNVAAMMAVVVGLLFTLVVFFSPQHGLVSKWLRNFSLSLRIAAEDVIGMLYRAEEAAGAAAGGSERIEGTAGMTEARRVTHGLAGLLAIPHLRRRGEIRVAASGGLELTDAGRELARSIVRSHRLWEAYLGEQTDLPLDHLHEPAERMEHFIGRELQEQLAASVAASDVDPHGRKIPADPPAKPLPD